MVFQILSNYVTLLCNLLSHVMLIFVLKVSFMKTLLKTLIENNENKLNISMDI